MNNFISKTVQNPYRMIKNTNETIFLYDRKYVIKLELTGEFGDKKVYCTAGSSFNNEDRNYFILTKLEIDDLYNKINRLSLGQIYESHTEFCTQTLGYIDIEVVDGEVKIVIGYRENKDYDITMYAKIGDFISLKNALQRLSSDLVMDYNMKKYEDSLMDTLHEYIDKGYIQEIKLENLNKETTGFNPVVYKTFKISIIPIYDIPSDAGINLTFSFIKCLHLDINEDKYNETINSITNGNKDIKLTFVNYNRKKEISNYITKAKKELADYDFTKRKTPSKADIKKAREIMTNLGMIKK